MCRPSRPRRPYGPTTGLPTLARRSQLPLPQLFQISLFWFSLNAIWGGFEIFQQKRAIQLLGGEAPIGLGLMEFLAMPIAVLSMPVAGSISDYVDYPVGSAASRSSCSAV